MDADRVFHAGVSELAGNRLLKQIMATYWVHITRLMCVHLSLPGFPLQSFAEHRALLEALQAGDGERAARLASRHVLRAKDALVALAREGGRHEEWPLMSSPSTRGGSRC